jgi:pyridoxine kinase
MRPQIAAAINDMSGYGRCSLTVALPILSVMGVQCCPLPTAFLSTHTDDCFRGFTFHDMTKEIRPAYDHWKNVGVELDGVMCGFLGSEEQIGIVGGILRELRENGVFVLVDPVMADKGEVYKTYTPAMCAGMAELALAADIITPNSTEASILLGLPLSSKPESESEAVQWLNDLSLGGKRSVVLTGVDFDGEHVGAAAFDKASGRASFSYCRRVARYFPGTGDVFASVLMGALMRKYNLDEAVKLAVSFIFECMDYTVKSGGETREGIYFEPFLYKLAVDK